MFRVARFASPLKKSSATVTKYKVRLTVCAVDELDKNSGAETAKIAHFAAN